MFVETMFNECQRANKDASWKQGVSIKHEEVWPPNRDEMVYLHGKDACSLMLVKRLFSLAMVSGVFFQLIFLFCFVLFFSLSSLSPELLKY